MQGTSSGPQRKKSERGTKAKRLGGVTRIPAAQAAPVKRTLEGNEKRKAKGCHPDSGGSGRPGKENARGERNKLRDGGWEKKDKC